MTTYTAQHAYGWVRDLPDHRDRMLTLTNPTASVPDSVDLRPSAPPVYNQGQLGSCSANAWAAAFDTEHHHQLESFLTPSRLFIYYNERVEEGTVRTDSGAQIRDGIKTLLKQGAAPEAVWPYDITRFTQKPPRIAYKDGAENLAVHYQRVPQVESAIKQVLAGLTEPDGKGRPVVIGFTVYESFETAQVASTGIMPTPTPDEEVLGGHAVVVYGYQMHDGDPYWIVRNSWGNQWGIGGYFLMPHDYLLNPNLSADFWSLTTVTR